MPVGTIVLLLSSSCPYKASRCRWAANLSLHQTGKHRLPHPGDSLRPHPIQIMHQPSLSQWLFLTSGQPLLAPRAFLKSPKGPQSPNKQNLASVHPVPLVKWPPAGHWWQLASVCSRAFARCLQAQYEQLPTTDHFVASTRWPWAEHRQQLTWVCTRTPPKRAQKRYAQWPAPNHTREPPDELHK